MVIISSSLRLFTCIIIGLFIYSDGFAQINAELDFITTNNPIDKHDVMENLSLSFNETSELKIAFMGLIRFYQNFISSQQNNQSICIFSPSCSRFGFAAIKKHGLLNGILMTSDRLQRCHGFSRKYYSINLESGKLYDPIEYHYIKMEF